MERMVKKGRDGVDGKSLQPPPSKWRKVGSSMGLANETFALKIPSMTTTKRDLLIATNGMAIYNTTTSQFESYENGSWVSSGEDDHGGLAGLADDDHTQYYGSGLREPDHTALSNIGTNAHSVIDTHIGDATKHFTEASIDHGAIGGLTDDDHVRYFDKDGSKAMTGDLDFANLKAIAMVCDNGTTMPSSGITAGQWFLHTPTGRNILYMYDGSNWGPVASIGTMTVYVDNTDGTDSVDKGFGVDSDAFATIQYAWDAIPPTYNGNVIININAETYVENLNLLGKVAGGTFTITLQGTVTLEETISSATVSVGTDVTQGTVTSVGDFAGDSYDNLLVYFVTDDEWRIIDSHTDDVLTLVAVAPSATTQDVKIYSAGTIVDPSSGNAVTITSGQVGLYFREMSLVGTSAWGCACIRNSQGFFYNCLFNTASIVANNASAIELYQCYIKSSTSTGISLQNASLLRIEESKVDALSNSKDCISPSRNSYANIRHATIVDAGGGTGDGYDIANGGIVEFTNIASWGYNRVRNCNVGVQALTGSLVTGTALNVYTSNDTDESATGVDPTYVD